MVPPDNELSGGTPLTWSRRITNYPEGRSRRITTSVYNEISMHFSRRVPYTSFKNRDISIALFFELSSQPAQGI